ncbi:acetate/propionate family kinase [Sneathiella sp.]|uniref:acetate/propionate family kinase n=1 Tax=Sneathiella sp. TaxID=1964365 RepID=UPI00356AE1CA
MTSLILTCNAGSNNTKLAAFDANTLQRIDDASVHTAEEAAEWLKGKEGVVSIAHRVVHGGRAFIHPERLTNQVITQLTELIPLAPLHQPAALKIIAAARKQYPDVPHIACFDTAFHHTMPEINRRLPLPRKYHDEGLVRYGFHGLSYQHIADVLPEQAAGKIIGRVIAAHLGGGASACAMKDLESMDSTMGFSTLEGLMMGTRCGALDPGVLLYLLETDGMPLPALSDLLYHNSGLKGVSGISDNMRELLQSTAPCAIEAVELYCTLAAKQIAGLVPSIGGLDALVFTGGIGENAKPIRERIIARLRWIGDFDVYVIPTDEELVMARACKALQENKDTNKTPKERKWL